MFCSGFAEFEFRCGAKDLLHDGHCFNLENWHKSARFIYHLESGVFDREIMAPSDVGKKVVEELFPSGYGLAYILPYEAGSGFCVIRPVKYSCGKVYGHPSKSFKLYRREMAALFPEVWVPSLDKEILDI